MSVFEDFYNWPQNWPWALIIPLYLLLGWLLAGVTTSFIYWLKKDSKTSKKWFFYSFSILIVMAMTTFLWWGIKAGWWFKKVYIN